MVALAMMYGHDPREARNYSMRDLELLTLMVPVIEQQRSLGGLFHG